MSKLYPRGFLLSHLSGEARLFSAWWVFYVLGKVMLYLPVGGFFAWVLISKRFHELDMVLFKQVTLGWFCLLVLHGLLASWVVWRCARNTSSPVWTWLARGVVILGLSSLAGGLPEFLH